MAKIHYRFEGHEPLKEATKAVEAKIAASNDNIITKVEKEIVEVVKYIEKEPQIILREIENYKLKYINITLLSINILSIITHAYFYFR